MIHKLPNGSSIAWKKYHSPYNYINLFDVLQDGDMDVKLFMRSQK